MAAKLKITGLSGNEIYCLRKKGLLPSGVLVGNSVQSMGFMGSIGSALRGVVGGIKSAFKGLVRGEISDLTTLIYDARENVFDRIESEAEALGADEVVGIKLYIVELGSNLVEMVGVGTAVRLTCPQKGYQPSVSKILGCQV